MVGGWLLNLVSGGALKAITGEIGEWQKRKLNAENADKRIEADKELGRLEAKASVLRAEAKDTINKWFRGFIAIGPGTYVFSYFFIDKVLCVKLGLSGAFCRVDAIDDPVMSGVMAAVIGFYFVTEAMNARR